MERIWRIEEGSGYEGLKKGEDMKDWRRERIWRIEERREYQRVKNGENIKVVFHAKMVCSKCPTP